MNYTLTSLLTGFKRNEEYFTNFEVHSLIEESRAVAVVTDLAD